MNEWTTPTGRVLRVGDKVTVKSKYDKGKCAHDYKFSFSYGMLSLCGGKTYTITRIVEVQSNGRLGGDSPNISLEDTWYSWTYAMFEDAGFNLKLIKGYLWE